MTATLVQVFKAAAAQAKLSCNNGNGNGNNNSTGLAKDISSVAPGSISLHELLQMHGEASTAVVLLLLALFSTFPVAGIGSVISLAIFVLAWRWGRHVETTSVHGRIGNIRLNPIWTRRCLDFLAWLYEQADRWLEPRLPGLSARNSRPWWALWICVMGGIIFLPIPLGNLLPSFSLVVLSLAWMFRDGIALMVSLALGVAAIVFTAFFGQLAWQLVVNAGQWVMNL